MALYSANAPARTVNLHKRGCSRVPVNDLSSCGCGETARSAPSKRNQKWWCEKHVTIAEVDKFMRDRKWAILPCDMCFGSFGGTE